jgi:hypothetical protein
VESLLVNIRARGLAGFHRPLEPLDKRTILHGGTTTDTSGLVDYDEANVILFNDPNGELPAFSCSSGGVHPAQEYSALGFESGTG